MPSEDKETSVPQPKKPFGYIILNKRLSNLQLDDVTQPVYDRRTSEERMARQLPLELPSIPLYTEKKVAYLTFDDGPDCVNTPKILDILEQYEVPATFYVLGCRAEQNPDVLQRIFREGHAVGNHSYDHDYSTLYGSPNDFLWQIIHTEEIIRNILGVRPLIVRAPGGASGNFTEDFWQAMKNYGYVEHDWNVCTNDATPEDPDAAGQIGYVDVQTSGELKDDMALVLMHSTYGKQETANALRGIIAILRERGFTFGVVTPMTPQPL